MAHCQAITKAGTQCKNKALYPENNPISCGLAAHLDQLGVSKTTSEQKIPIPVKPTEPSVSVKSSETSSIPKKQIIKKKQKEEKKKSEPTLDQLRVLLMERLDKFKELRGVIKDLMNNGKKIYGQKAYTQIASYMVKELTSVYQVQKPKMLEMIGLSLQMSEFSTISEVEKKWLLSEVKPQVERTLDFLEKLINGSGGGGGKVLQEYETEELLATLPEIPTSLPQIKEVSVSKEKQKIKKAVALEVKRI